MTYQSPHFMSQEKVLIVEDEENERTGLAELVSAWGYRAETAKDGAEGLEKVTNWSPSIVVTDLKMPRMGGLELLERLASDGQTMAVVVVTAQGSIDSAVQAMRMGAYDYITKPIDTDRLRTILQNASTLLGTRVELEVTRRKLRDALDEVSALRCLQRLIEGIHQHQPRDASRRGTGEERWGERRSALAQVGQRLRLQAGRQSAFLRRQAAGIRPDQPARVGQDVRRDGEQGGAEPLERYAAFCRALLDARAAHLSAWRGLPAGRCLARCRAGRRGWAARGRSRPRPGAAARRRPAPAGAGRSRHPARSR